MWGLENVSAATPRGRFIVLCLVMGVATLLSLLEAVLMLNWAPLLAAFLGWCFVLVYGVVEAGILHRGAGAVAALTLPSGAATPSVNQHSNIQALVAKGAFGEAADAYRRAIASEPQDVVACEQLTQLALRELKDWDLALFALREAERRSSEPRRRAGYALLAANVYRDNLKDYGKTIVELRRILAVYPGVPNANALRAEIEELKAVHFEAPAR
jgi:tetratricopeptide (TPR) repeat protein